MKNIFFPILLAIIYSVSCNKDKNSVDDIQDVPVNLQLQIVNYPSLNAVNGWEYVSGGVKGILIFRISTDEFKAFERNCTYKPSESCAVISVDSTGLAAVDDCCGSKFSLLDGSVSKSPASKSLKEYVAIYDGSILSVTN